MAAVASTSERGKTLTVWYFLPPFPLLFEFDLLENDGLNLALLGGTRVSSFRAKSMMGLTFLRVSLTEGASFGAPTSMLPIVSSA